MTPTTMTPTTMTPTTMTPTTIINGSVIFDKLTGGDASDLINGLGGNDILIGMYGDDTLDGGIGHDQLYGGPDKDLLLGGSGNDLLAGGWNDDVLYGGEGNDTLFGNEQEAFWSLSHYDSNVFFGEEGDDSIHLGKASDVAHGGTGNDNFYIGEVIATTNHLIEGDYGIDSIVFQNTTRENNKYKIHTSGDLTIRSSDDSNVYISANKIERLIFSDSRVALDLNKGDSAYIATAIIGAINKSMVNDPYLMGTAINFIDSLHNNIPGYSLSSQKDKVITAIENLQGAGVAMFSPDNSVGITQQIFTNLIGRSASTAELDSILPTVRSEGIGWLLATVIDSTDYVEQAVDMPSIELVGINYIIPPVGMV